MEATGDVAVKAGAEGLQCAAAVGPGLGVAVKVRRRQVEGMRPR